MLYMPFRVVASSAMDPRMNEVVSDVKEDNQNLAIKLYHPFQIAILTFLGTPFAGLLAIALNYRSLGQRSAFIKALVISIVVLLLIMALYIYIPRTPYDRLFPGVMALLLAIISRQLFFTSTDHQPPLAKQPIVKMLLLVVIGLLVSLSSLMLVSAWLA